MTLFPFKTRGRDDMPASKIGRTARKTLCRKTIERAEMIAKDFVRMSERLQVKVIQEVQDILEYHTNCELLANLLTDIKTQYEMVNKDYSIREEYETLRSRAQKAYSTAIEHKDKLEVAREFETLHMAYRQFQESYEDNAIIRAVYKNDKTFEKEVIENEGW